MGALAPIHRCVAAVNLILTLAGDCAANCAAAHLPLHGRYACLPEAFVNAW